MNLGEIKAQFTGLMNRRDLTANTALVQTFIDQAVMRIQRELRCPAMEKSVNVTISSDYVGLVIPNDFLELINIIPAESNDRIDKVDITKALKAAENVGCPTVYSRQAGLWVLGPAPASASVIRIDYYAELSPLAIDTDSNTVSMVAWDLIVYAALVQASTYYKDKRVAEFEAQYQTILTGLQEQSDQDELGGTSEVQLTYSFDCE